VELKKGEEPVGFVTDESVDLIFGFFKEKDKIGRGINRLTEVYTSLLYKAAAAELFRGKDRELGREKDSYGDFISTYLASFPLG